MLQDEHLFPENHEALFCHQHTHLVHTCTGIHTCEMSIYRSTALSQLHAQAHTYTCMRKIVRAATRNHSASFLCRACVCEGQNERATSVRARERASRIFLGDVTVGDHHAGMHALNPLYREPPDRRWHFILVCKLKAHIRHLATLFDQEPLINTV